MPDPRRITVPAPPAGEAMRPPARRVPEIVGPEPTMPLDTPPAELGPKSVFGNVSIPAPTASPARQDPVIVNTPAAPRAPKPSTATRPAGPTNKRRWSRKRIGIGVVAVFSLLFFSTMIWGYLQFQSIDRLDLTPVLASDRGTNYLFVGSDTREGIDPDDPNADAILGDDSTSGPERSDTILILRVTGSGTQMLSVPRDLYVTIAETGERQRINAAFNGGPARLIATLEDQLGLPIHHYIQVNFASFGTVVDAVGGISVDIPNPVIDRNSGLDVPIAGRVTLDGTQALAYVRSRHYIEIIDGREVADVQGDLGRIARQQVFLSALMNKVASTRNPLALRRISASLVEGLTIDDDLGYFTALGLLRRMRGIDPLPSALPVSNFRTSGGAQVLNLIQPGANEVLARFGSEGASVS